MDAPSTNFRDRGDSVLPTSATTQAHTGRGGRRLGDHTSDRDNNFDVLRLLAAWLVLVSHSFALTGHDEPLHQFGTTLGNVSVLVFFAISGLLIHRSWAYDPRPRDFWAKRALRLLPALAVVAVLTAFVLGPIVTELPLSDYFSALQTWIYPVRVTLLYTFGAQLPGVFVNNEVAGAVNGPLWSLPVEVFAYGMLAVLGTLGVLRRPRLLVAITVLSLIWTVFWVRAMPFAIAQLSVLSGFAVGATCYALRDRIILSLPIACGLLALAAVTATTDLRPATWTLAIAYLSFYLAYAVPRFGQVFTRLGDASYGMYIFAFPIQQLLWWATDGKIGPWTMILVASPIVWLLALASWHWIERPALRHKPHPSRAV